MPHDPLKGKFNQPSPQDASAFIAAVRANDLKTVQDTLSANPGAVAWQDRAGNTALMMAVINGPSPLVDLLLAKGADVNAQNKHGGNALARAAHFGHKDLVERLLSLGADPAMKDAAQQDAAAWARMNGHEEIATRVEAAQKAQAACKSPPPPELK